MKKLGHSHIDVLKIDIKGIEHNVISSLILESSILRNVLLLGFHHSFKVLTKQNTENAVNQLRQVGYFNTEIFIFSDSEICFNYLPIEKL